MADGRLCDWQEVFFSIENLLSEIENQQNNEGLRFHEAAQLLNRLEMTVSILRSLFNRPNGGCSSFLRTVRTDEPNTHILGS